MLVVAMYTKDTPYEKQIKVLEKSCKKFDLNYAFHQIKNTGDWLKNCKQNTGVILDVMKCCNEDILYVDADAEFVKLPLLFEWFEMQDDIYLMAHVLRYPEFTRACTGTLFLKNNEYVKEVLKRWSELNEGNKEFDDDNLWTVIKDDGYFAELPQGYCSIDKCRVQTDHIPVIKQWQKSREFKGRK